jgi:hypothetical protein
VTYPHGPATIGQHAAPKKDPREEPCGECTHFKSWHEGNRARRPWQEPPNCGAWTPDGRCRCTGWEPKKR